MSQYLHSDREWLSVGFGPARESAEPPLQQRRQTGAPITDHEQKQEWNREVILIVDGVKDRQREISSDQKFDPRNPSQPLAVFLRADPVLLRFDAVLRSTGEGGLLAGQGFEHGTRIGDRQPDSQSHQ